MNPVGGLELQDSVCRGWHRLILAGELDIASCEQLRAALERLCVEGISGISLDLSRVSFIDSSGLHLLIELAARCQQGGWGFSLAPGSGAVARLLDLTGAAENLPLEPPPDATPPLGCGAQRSAPGQAR